MAKFELIPVSNVPNVNSLARILGCRVSSSPLKYLGLPLGAPSKAKFIWDTIIEKMEIRLVGWKILCLSKGGRLTLIKSMLSNLPTYIFFFLFPIPIDVANWLENWIGIFLWGGLNSEFKFHLVNWKKVYTPFHLGGLWIRCMLTFNQALLGKWLWRYATERETFWWQVLDKIYCSLSGGWCSNVVIGPYGQVIGNILGVAGIPSLVLFVWLLDQVLEWRLVWVSFFEGNLFGFIL